jgi:hypothetical protein
VVGFTSDDTVLLRLDGGEHNSSMLRVGGGMALLGLEGGEETFGVVNVAASEDGVWMGGDWNDEHDFDLTASEKSAGLSISTRTGDGATVAGEEEPPEPPPEIELSSTAGAGSVLVRKGDDVVFQSP